MFESKIFLNKDPETPKKMAMIYKRIQQADWMEDEETVQKVQEIARTII
ncbi:hypothetical protein RV12_GL002069 [Enterococcus quebecensis]|nr:hypothetical protein RV12_GL002069 [Enterococcus quebecensis]